MLQGMGCQGRGKENYQVLQGMGCQGRGKEHH